MNNKNEIFKFIFSGVFIIIAMLMIFFNWFRNRINSTIIILLIIAFIPWLVNYIKSLEAFGMKVDLLSNEKKDKIDEEIEKISKNAIKEEKIISSNTIIDKNQPIGSEKNPLLIESMELIARTSNPVEKMVLIRYEIEKEIKILCRVNNIQTYQQSIRKMIEELRKNKIIDNIVANLLLDIWPVLNKAVHSEIKNIDANDIDWVIDKGSALVMHLEIISKDPSKYWMIPFNN